MAATLLPPVWTPLSFFAPILRDSTIDFPISEATKRRNTILDALFYDVGSLSEHELEFLVSQTNLEGSVLVVHPRNSAGALAVEKYENYAALRAAPGDLLTRFSIAGVGSSDVGAAALARNLADHYDEPIGAIVAGYGVADLLAEAMGGWFFLGGANRLMKLFHDREADAAAALERYEGSIKDLDAATASSIATTVTGSPDSDTLLRLLLDEDREVKTLLGHSKGCLSIAYALQALAVSGAGASQQKVRSAQIVTTGAVVEFPDGYENTTQFLGSFDCSTQLFLIEGRVLQDIRKDIDRPARTTQKPKGS